MYLLLLDCSSFYKNGLSYHNAKYKCQHKCGIISAAGLTDMKNHVLLNCFFLPYPKKYHHMRSQGFTLDNTDQFINENRKC